MTSEATGDYLEFVLRDGEDPDRFAIAGVSGKLLVDIPSKLRVGSRTDLVRAVVHEIAGALKLLQEKK